MLNLSLYKGIIPINARMAPHGENGKKFRRAPQALARPPGFGALFSSRLVPQSPKTELYYKQTEKLWKA